MTVASLSARNSLIATLGVLDPTMTSSTDSAGAAWFTDQAGDSNSSLTSVSSAATSFSQTATLLSTLSKLSASDPEQFKEAAKEISADLREAASLATDSATAYSLTSLAGQFSNAAATGSISSLAPAASAQGASSRLKGYASLSAGTSLFSQSLTGNGATGLRDVINSIIAGNLGGASSSEES